jgi:hypothetical protein
LGAQMMIQEAITRCGMDPAQIAVRINYSRDAIYKAQQGTRPVPRDAGTKLSALHPLWGMAIALQETGYRLFNFATGDRHPQVLIRRDEKEDHEADQALKTLPYLILDKHGPEDMTPEDYEVLRTFFRESIESISARINLMIELDDRYQAGLLDELRGDREKDRSKAAHHGQQIKERSNRD